MSAAYWNGMMRVHAQAGRRSTASNTKTGWADDRMMQAYDLIWEVMKANEACGVASEFTAVLRAVEAADEILVEEKME